MLNEEVKRGWQLLLPKEAALETPRCEVALLGMVVQKTIDERGELQRKLRLTRDQSFNPKRISGAQRQRQSRRDNPDPSKIWEGFQPISVPHLVFEEGQGGQTHLHDKRQLQILLQTDPFTGINDREGMHVH